MLVAEYESEDESGDEDIAVPVATEEKRDDFIALNRSKQYLETAKVLPAEILAALEGRIDLDEDDDDDDIYLRRAVIRKKESSNIPTVSAVEAPRNGLLALLPAARNGLGNPNKVEDVRETQEERDDGYLTLINKRPERVQQDIDEILPSAMTKPKLSVPQNKKASRKRERVLEEALMAGDVASLPADGIIFEEVKAHIDTRTPDQLAAVSELTSEIKVATPFYDPRTGTNIITHRPSKLQRRRHQINSLAVSAAERELELLERNQNALKTKSQTQAKYGW